MAVEPYEHGSVAAWLLAQQLDWNQLVTTGPLDYEAYARLRFMPDPEYDGQSENDATLPDDPGQSEMWQLAVAVSHLARHSSTGDELFFLIWDGWPGSYGHPRCAIVELVDERFGVVRRYFL